MKKPPSLDLYHALTVSADALAEVWGGAGVAALMAWGDPAEIEVLYCRGLHEEVCRGLTTAAGRVLVDGLRRRNQPVRLQGSKLGKELAELREAMESSGLEGLLLVPMASGPGSLGVVCVELEASDFSRSSGTEALALALVDRACRSLAGLHLAAAAGALAVTLVEDHGSEGSVCDGVVVLDRWERVVFSSGLFVELPGWERHGAFGRSVDSLPGGALLSGVRLSKPGATQWEEHLFPPTEDGAIPVSLAAVPFGARGDGGGGRIVLLRDLRTDVAADPTARLMALALRVAGANEGVQELLGSEADGPKGTMARRFQAFLEVVRQKTSDVHRLVGEAVRRTEVPGEEGRVDLDGIIQRLLEEREADLAREGVRVLRFLRPELSQVTADPVALQHILAGLLDQARASLRPGGGTLTLRTWEESGEVYVAVSDDGRGVGPGPDLEAFQPLYTELGAGSRSEAFLDEARALVAPWRGRVMVESRPGLWNRLTLMLPAAVAAAEGRGRAGGGALPPAVRIQTDGDGLQVLVVDDNPSLRSVIRRFLERRGHRVTEAADGSAALDLLGSRAFDRVMVDVRMPGTDGPTFYERLDSVAPDLRRRTIFMTGGFLEREVEDFILSTGRPAIQKPFDLGEMARAVEEAA